MANAGRDVVPLNFVVKSRSQGLVGDWGLFFVGMVEYFVLVSDYCSSRNGIFY